MGIKDIKLGPKSRMLQEPQDEVAHPPLPGPANPTSLRGCGCGRWHIPVGVTSITVTVDGVEVEHRYSAECRRVGGGPVPRTKTPAELAAENLSLRDEVRRLTERIEFLEAALGVLERELPADPLDPLPPPTSGKEIP